MRVLLIGINAKFIHSNLAIRYLKEYTAQLPFECDIKEFSINDRKERILEEIIKEKADLIGFSCYIWNIELVLQLATLIKKIDSSIEIIYGGPEASYDSSTFLMENPGEYVIEGEGEETFKEFIEFKLGHKKKEEVRGLYYKEVAPDMLDSGSIGYGGKRDLIDMNNIIFPYKDTEDLKDKIIYYEAQRGCPFKCKYCLSSTTHGVRFLNIERVKKELQFFIDQKVNLVKFVDRTFNCNYKFSRQIWEFIIEANTDTRFHFEISADLLKEEDLRILNEAPEGRIQFEIGVQTTNEKVLNNINRGADFFKIKEKVLEIRKLKSIHQHLDLIAGLPEEDFMSFKQSFNDVYSCKPEVIQLGFLKLLKGSAMREESEKWGIVFSPYPPYEILSSKNLSYEELLKLKGIEELVDKYYNSGKFNTILKYFVNKFESPFDFYFTLSQYFSEIGFYKRNISAVDYYKVFKDFNKDVLQLDNSMLLDIIKYDYLMYNKKKWLPEFLNRDIDKNLENSLKKSIKEKYNIMDTNKIHIEKFDVDINVFMSKGILVPKKCYYLFDEKNHIHDITSMIYEYLA